MHDYESGSRVSELSPKTRKTSPEETSPDVTLNVHTKFKVIDERLLAGSEDHNFRPHQSPDARMQKTPGVFNPETAPGLKPGFFGVKNPLKTL
jgi:hypothetical protein